MTEYQTLNKLTWLSGFSLAAQRQGLRKQILSGLCVGIQGGGMKDKMKRTRGGAEKEAWAESALETTLSSASLILFLELHPVCFMPSLPCI